MTAPVLLGYQRRWLADRSLMRNMVKSRAIGGSYIASLDLAGKCLGHDIEGARFIDPADGFVFSASHAQAIVLLKEVARHVAILEQESIANGGPPLLDGKPSATQIRLLNGCGITALSNNPDTARGNHGHVLWDEVGSTPRAKELYQAILPIANAIIPRPEGFSISLVGTALDDGSFFQKICETDEGAMFSRHRVTAVDALADGFPINLEAKRKEVGEERWAAEYMCQFMSAASRYIDAATYDAALYEPGDMPPGGWPMYGGMDVGRTHDESVIVDLYKAGDTLWHKGTEREKGMPFADQRAWVDRGMARRSKFAIDKMGLGMEMAEALEQKYRGKAEGVPFNLTTKEEMATSIKLGLQNGRLRLRADDIDLRTDVLSMRREFTSSGHARYVLGDTARGHADGAWALGLAVYAAGGVASTSTGVRGVTAATVHTAQRPVKLPTRRGSMFR